MPCQVVVEEWYNALRSLNAEEKGTFLVLLSLALWHGSPRKLQSRFTDKMTQSVSGMLDVCDYAAVANVVHLKLNCLGSRLSKPEIRAMKTSWAYMKNYGARGDSLESLNAESSISVWPVWSPGGRVN